MFYSRTKPPKVDKDEDPGVGLMKLMKQMYNDGDDEMKRTIAKAWHESQEKRAKGMDDLSWELTVDIATRFTWQYYDIF